MAASIEAGDIYFEGSRSEIADMVPTACRRILDVGCGFGGLGRALKERGFTELFGVEINPESSKRLEGIYEQYWIGDVEALKLPSDLEGFDCIIFADILEHLNDPWSTLRSYLEHLKPDGAVIVSIPNVRNVGLLYRLIFQGKWEYEDFGLLDRTHLRFFTRASIEEMLQGAGLKVERWEVNRDNYSGMRKLVSGAAKLISQDMDVCQYLVLGRKI